VKKDRRLWDYERDFIFPENDRQGFVLDGSVLFWISLCSLCVLCVSGELDMNPEFTTETQRTQR
jgi:hypothetical protein